MNTLGVVVSLLLVAHGVMGLPKPRPDAAVTDICTSEIVDALQLDQVTSVSSEINAQAELLVESLQEFRGENLLLMKLNNSATPEDLLDMQFLQTYGMSFAPIVGPVIVIFALALIIFPFFVCARCCCSTRCCKPKKLIDEYSMLEIFLPMFFYMLFALAAAALAVVSVSSMNSIYNGIISTICEVEMLMNDTGNLLDEIVQPLGGIGESTLSLISQVNETLDETDAISMAISVVISLMRAYASDLRNVTLPANVTSDLLSTSADKMSTVATEIETSSSEFTNQFDSIKSVVDDSLAGVGDMITELLSSSTGELANIESTIRDTSFLGPIKGGIAQFWSFGSIASYAFYSIVFLALVSGVFVILMYILPGSCTNFLGRTCLSLSWFLSYLFLLLLLLLGSVYFPLSIVLSDVCVIAYELPQNLDKYVDLFLPGDALRELQSDDNPLGSIDPVAIVSGCFATPSIPLLVSLNLTGGLNVEQLLGSFSLDINTTNLLDTSQLTNFSNTINNLQIADFGLTQDDVDTVMEALNNLTSAVNATIVYTQNDCLDASTCAPVGDGNNNLITPSVLNQARQGAVDIVTAYDTLNTTLTWMKANATEIVLSGDNVLDIVTNVLDEISNIDAVVLSLATSFDEFGNSGDCSFIAERYYNLHSHLCGDTLGGMFLVSLYNIVIAILAIPVVITSVCINIRMFGVGARKEDAAVHAWNEK